MKAVTVRGVTMIELLVVIAIVAVLLGVGVPSFRSLIAAQKVKAAAAELQINLNLTRAEALKRNATVTLKPITGSNWMSGWTVSDAANIVLSTTPATTATITGPASVKYRASGRIDATAPTAFQVSGTGSTEVRCVAIEVTGMSVTTKGAC